MTKPSHTHGLFGAPPPDLIPDDMALSPRTPRQQFSPLIPGAAPLAAMPEASLSDMVMLAPPGTIERRRALALALRAVAPAGTFVAMAPKDKGGARLAKELKGFGCDVAENVKHHHRICRVTRPETLVDIEPAMAEGAMRFVEETGYWSQPGVFSWDRIDPGSALLAAKLPKLSGCGADLGCGYGYLGRAILASDKVTRLTLIDIDGRAIEAAKHNLEDARARCVWADLRSSQVQAAGIDFVVMNAPFHDGGSEDRSLTKLFVERAASSLRSGGTCWLVANRHLPYEGVMGPLFKRTTLIADERGYKVYEAVK